MPLSMNSVLLLGFMAVHGALFAAPALAQSVDGEDCPLPVSPSVRMPPEAVRAGLKGEVHVSARFDACGRVIEAKIIKRVRMDSVNQAALDGVKRMVLTPTQRESAVDGWYTRVFSFIGQSTPMRATQVAWPSSHEKPAYVQDDAGIGYSTVADADKAIVDSVPGALRPPVYNFAHRFAQVDAPGGTEFWLFISAQGRPVVAARYRPLVENERPVVKLAVMCELEAQQCDGVRGILMRGLPFAPAG